MFESLRQGGPHTIDTSACNRYTICSHEKQYQFSPGEEPMWTDTVSRMAEGATKRMGHSEGALARMIEQQTAKLPSDLFLWSAVGAIGLSLAMALTGRQQTANFIGQWVPTLLIFGLYNKIVKVAGHERESEA